MKPEVQRGPDYVRIVRKIGSATDILACWHQREWKKNPLLVYQIVEAITVAAFEPELLEATLKELRK